MRRVRTRGGAGRRGGFGPKLVFYPEEAAVAIAALILGRPVRWIEDRREHFIATTQERDQYWDAEIALDSEGKILGVRGSLIHDHGAYTARGLTVPQGAVAALSLAYVVPAYRVDVKVALTNKVPVTPVRGAGQPQGVFVMERLLDRAARELEIDRAEIRRRNLVPADAMPFKKDFVTRGGVPIVLDSGDYPACQADALARAEWNDFPRRQRQARGTVAILASVSPISWRRRAVVLMSKSVCGSPPPAKLKLRPGLPRWGKVRKR